MLLQVIFNKDDIRKIQINSLLETLEEFFSLLKFGEMKKKKADMKKIEEMMVSTFSLWRKQIVEEEPPVAEVKIKWPALFTEQQASVFIQGYRLVICSFNFGFGRNSNVYTKLSWISNIVSLLTLYYHISYLLEFSCLDSSYRSKAACLV